MNSQQILPGAVKFHRRRQNACDILQSGKKFLHRDAQISDPYFSRDQIVAFKGKSREKGIIPKS
jgi:hypothetical protein